MSDNTHDVLAEYLSRTRGLVDKLSTDLCNDDFRNGFECARDVALTMLEEYVNKRNHNKLQGKET